MANLMMTASFAILVVTIPLILYRLAVIGQEMKQEQIKKAKRAKLRKMQRVNHHVN